MNTTIFMWSFDSVKLRWLWLAPVMVAFVSTLGRTAIVRESGLKIHCTPRTLYRGETLHVSIRGDHEGYELAVESPGHPGFLMMISFMPGPEDRIVPVIPPDDFAKMYEIDLPAATAKGSVSNWGQSPIAPFALKRPELIFVRTGRYQVRVGGPIGVEDSDEATCDVTYYDEPRPKHETHKPK